MKIDLAKARKGVGVTKPHIYPTYYPRSGRYYMRVCSLNPTLRRVRNMGERRHAIAEWDQAHSYAIAHNNEVGRQKHETQCTRSQVLPTSVPPLYEETTDGKEDSVPL